MRASVPVVLATTACALLGVGAVAAVVPSVVAAATQAVPGGTSTPIDGGLTLYQFDNGDRCYAYHSAVFNSGGAALQCSFTPRSSAAP